MQVFVSTQEIKEKIQAFSDESKGFAVAEVLMALLGRIEMLEQKKENKTK